MPLGYMFCELIDFPPLPSDWLAGGVPLLKKLLIMYIISIRKIKDFTVAHTPGLACSCAAPSAGGLPATSPFDPCAS